MAAGGLRPSFILDYEQLDRHGPEVLADCFAAHDFVGNLPSAVVNSPPDSPLAPIQGIAH